MSKPICKAEAKWKCWRDDGRSRYDANKFSAKARKLMRRARRKFLRNMLNEKTITKEYP